MRAVLQRVRRARVLVEDRITGEIGRGLVVLLGVRKGDGEAQVKYLGDKVLDVRLLADDAHGMNRSLRDTGGQILLVSQFTLYGDCRRGRRPSFDEAESPAAAASVYRRFAAYLKECGFPPQEGVFGAAMVVELENDGPVTVLLDSERAF